MTWAVGSTIRELFKSSYKPQGGQLGIAVSITLFSGAVLFQASVDDGVQPDNWNWVAGKTATVKRYSRSSFFVGRNAAAKGAGAVERQQKLAAELTYAAHGGALPIRLKGMDLTNPVGVIVVSGLPQEQDHQLVFDACRKVLWSREMSSVCK
ncbi:hypothetical protein EXIGLDRAFT_843338 [Exidia glandulosa HHB12029]|uniref:DUF336-domain-containing protein n=1 Tax=Exidia glandulosa HHB12029 TaxID=1314781 RepID=A0A165CR11_EXIGL|nr:hypothetical protein EXIGLDRAFT_843338 [Exidia glandulosa HHB12029]